MQYADTKKTQKSESKPYLPFGDKDAKSPKHSVFTLNDGVKLLQLSSKNLSKTDSIKIPNLKLHSIEKQISQKSYLNRGKNILSINPIKGKSIFNNCILDNVLGTININPNVEPIAANKIFKKNETSFDNLNINKDFDAGLGVFKRNVSGSKKNLIFIKREKDPEPNLNKDKFENSNEEEMENSKSKKLKEKENKVTNKNDHNDSIIDSEIKDNKQNLFNLQSGANSKRKISSDNDLRLLHEEGKCAKNLKTNKSFIDNDDVKDKCENESWNIKEIKMRKGNITNNNNNNSVNNTNNLTNNEFYSNKQEKISSELNKNNNNGANTHKNFVKDLNSINNEYKLSSPKDNFFHKNQTHVWNSALNFMKIQTQMHSKELKFELYKGNKLIEPIKEFKNVSDLNFSDSNLSNKISFKFASEKKNSNLNLLLNLDALGIKIEACTQTKNNFASANDEKNTTTKHSDKERLFSCSIKENSSKNPLKENPDNCNEIKLKSESDHKENSNFKNNKNIKTKNLQDTLISESNRKLDFTGDCFMTRNEFQKRGNNGLCSSTRYKENALNEAEKNCMFNYIKRSNFFSPVQQVDCNLDDRNNSDDNSKKTDFDNFNFRFNFVRSTSTNCRLNKKFNLNDFNKEIVYNSKILGENLIKNFKNKNKSPTGQIPGNSDNSYERKNLRIKFSNKVKMKKILMDMISPPYASEESKRDNENKTFETNKERFIQKLPVIAFKN